jgi:hypothetical protein
VTFNLMRRRLDLVLSSARLLTGAPRGAFATSYAAYRHALNATHLSDARPLSLTYNVNADIVRTHRFLEAGDAI